MAVCTLQTLVLTKFDQKGVQVMCEPFHSIVQFERPSAENALEGSAQGYGGTRLMIGMGKIGQFCKEVDGMFHISKMGAGHSGAIGQGGIVTGPRETFILPPHTDYEVAWWKRSIQRDGAYLYKRWSAAYDLYNSPESNRAMAAAKKYADAVSIGSLHALRVFLETSVQKTDRTNYYVRQFREMLNSKGRSEFEMSMKHVTGTSASFGYYDSPADRLFKPCLTKLMLGLTRKRHLLVPEWADDAALWTPPAKPSVMMTVPDMSNVKRARGGRR